MAEIQIEELAREPAWRFAVTVSERGRTSRHEVTLSEVDYQRLCGGACDPATLVRRSFEFLLEREPKESILREFELPVIGRYFPEYEWDIARRVGASH